MKIDIKKVGAVFLLVIAFPAARYAFVQWKSVNTTASNPDYKQARSLAELTTDFFSKYTFDNNKLLAKDEAVFRNYCNQLAEEFLKQHGDDVADAIVASIDGDQSRKNQARAQIIQNYAPLLARRFETTFAKTRKNHQDSLA